METNNPLDIQIGGSHYKNSGMQPIELSEGVAMNNCFFSILRYVCRHKDKKGKEDLEKALHYIELQKVVNNPWFREGNKMYLFDRFLRMNAKNLDSNQKLAILAIQTHNEFLLKLAIETEIKECYGED